MKKLLHFISKIYRISLHHKKQESLVWKDLKQTHHKSEWKSGVYEKERYIETVFTISEEKAASFYYFIHEGSLHCRVKVLENFSPEITTDIFVLASHFNNLLVNGIVKVDAVNQYVEYDQKLDLLVLLLYRGEIKRLISTHYFTAKDVSAAFDRLITEQEAPAIIIADLLKKKESKNQDNPE
jgi:hypothetical protein